MASVVVVGSGLAGLASAFELVDRGVQVQILESADHIGGLPEVVEEAELPNTPDQRDAIAPHGGRVAFATLLSAVIALTALGSLQLVPGARLTWSEEWGAHFTPRLSAMLRPVPSLALRASLGQGYRAPSFKELYMEFLNVGPGFGYVVKGNPRLRPETSTNVTVGAEWSPGRGFLRTQLFGTRFDDFIYEAATGEDEESSSTTFLTAPDLGAVPDAGEARLLVAARVGTTRLIDNTALTLGDRAGSI
mgnify:CR=1 FL=1